MSKSSPKLAIVTGDMMRDRLLALAGVTPEHLRHAMQRTVEALDAVAPAKRRVKTLANGDTEETIDDGGAPDWDARLRAADQLCERVGLRARPVLPDGDPGTPVTAIAIVLQAGTNGQATVRAIKGQGLEYRHLKLAPPNGHTNGNGHGA